MAWQALNTSKILNPAFSYTSMCHARKGMGRKAGWRGALCYLPAERLIKIMKKCPYCAEDIQDQAKVCKHCKRDLTQTPSANTSAPHLTLVSARPTNWRKIGKWIGIIVIALIALKFWYIGIPTGVAWYLFKKKKNKYSQKTNIIVSAATLVVFVLMGSVVAYANRAPSLTITEPQNQASVQAKSITVKGKVNPASSKISVNNTPAQVNNEGNFSYEATLNDENNTLTIIASNSDKATTQTLSIKRIFTAEEQVERDRLKAEADAKTKADQEAAAKAQAEADAKAAADQAAYDRSPAGKLCKAHPSWSKDDCQRVADKKYWIGMTYDMLVASLGSKPDHANPSSYGRTTEWQWCWSDYTPSCFYDNNNDSIIDSYN